MRTSDLATLLTIAAISFAGGASAVTPDISSKRSHTLALDANANVYAWGSDKDGQLGQGRTLYTTSPLVVPGIPSMVAAAAGLEHVVTVDTAGNAWTWGGTTFGQLGPRSEPNASKPGKVLGLTSVVAVSAGQTFSAALKADGTVWAWGGSIGLANPGAYSSAVRQIAGLSGITKIAAGDGHLLALKNDGTVWALGANWAGQLGDGTQNARSAAYQVPGVAGATHIAAGYANSVVRKSDGTVLAWGANYPQSTYRLSPLPVAGITTAVYVTANQYSFAVKSDGTVVRWDNTYAPATYATYTGIQQFAVGSGASGYTTYGLNGSGALFSDGGNFVGQRGLGTITFTPGVTAVPGLSGITHVSAGFYFAVARRSNGAIYVWGSNAEAQMGNGDTVSRSVPLPVPGLPAGSIVQIKAGSEFSLARQSNGAVWGWGNNDTAQIGPDYGTPRSTPALIPGLANIIDMAAGCTHALFLRNDGAVLFTGTVGSAFSTTPTVVAGLSNIVAVGGGCYGAFAIRNDGVLFAWGLNTYGQLGDGTTTNRPTPVPISGFSASVTAVDLQQDHAIARTSDGKVWTWGRNQVGQLGDGTTTDRSTPGLVSSLAGATSVAAGFVHSLALLSDGTVRAWGSNGNGALGDGTTTDRRTPVAVVGLDAITRISAGSQMGFAARTGGLAWGWGSDRGNAGVLAAVGDGTYSLRTKPVIVLREGASGNLDGAKWYLDLDPASPDNVPAAAVPKIIPVANVSGTTASLSLTAGINFRSNDYGKTVGTYILGYVPPAFLQQVRTSESLSKEKIAALAKANEPILVQLTPSGWMTITGQLVAYTSGTINANGGANDILNGINAGSIPGAKFCIGYGTSPTDMLSTATLSEVLTLDGASSTASALPCVLTGVYVSGPATSNAGSSVTFTATVVGFSPGGSVQLKDSTANLGAPLTLSSNSAAVSAATYSTNALAVGVHSIGAHYAGDVQNAASDAATALLHVVSQATTGTSTYLGGPASSLQGQGVTFTATVFGNNPGGSVQFKDGAANLGTSVPLLDGVASLATTTLVLGAHTITAVYSGDIGTGGTNTGSTSSALSHIVYDTITTSVSLASSPNPSAVGSPVTLTATVAGSNPTGSVTFRDGSSGFATVALTGGSASFVVSSFAPGLHVLFADYGGDAGNQVASTNALFQQVNAAIDPGQGGGDADADGIPNAVEVTVGRNPTLKDNDVFGNAQLFAMQQYRDFLNREGDAVGVNSWIAFLNGAGTRAAMVEGFFASGEFQGVISPVARLYFAYFLRIPDYDGLQFWINYFRAGNPLSTISNAFAGSGEFTSLYGALNNDQFVDLVYQNVLGRPADAGGKAFWLGQLNGGMTRGAMMIGFSESPEYVAAIRSEVNVTMTYIGMLRRAPDTGGFNFWVGYLDSGNSQQALITGFLSAPEYRSRFLP